MGKLIIVENDSVKGTDMHNVSGQVGDGSPYTGIGQFDYVGKMTGQLSDFVKIDSKLVALTSSKSSLNPGEDIIPTGKHSGPTGEDFIPSVPAPNSATLEIIDPIGEGTPSAISGSSFVKVGGIAVLLDADKIDTCDGLGIPMNSTVTAENQKFVFCSG